MQFLALEPIPHVLEGGTWAATMPVWAAFLVTSIKLLAIWTAIERRRETSRTKYDRLLKGILVVFRTSLQRAGMGSVEIFDDP